MDNELRTALWNVLDIFVWDELRGYETRDRHAGLAATIWARHFKLAVDTIPITWTKTIGVIRDHFFSCAWNDVYDLVEFVARVAPLRDDVIEGCNLALEQELSAYRLVGSRIVEMTTETEIKEVEEALS